ncbi:MAG: hypothetical protein WA821_21380, partial [Anaerolineales bacterium]
MKIARLLVCLCVLVLIWIPFAVASADSVPNPTPFWFTIESDPTTPEITGISVIRCKVKDCTETNATYSSDKDPNGKIIRIGNTFQWLFDFYHTRSDSSSEGYFEDSDSSSGYWQLIVRFANGKKVSTAIDDLPEYLSQTATYQVFATSNHLTIKRIYVLPPPAFSSFLLALVSESLVGATILMVWKKTTVLETLKFAGCILLVNLILYPALWSYFLSIAEFHSKDREIWGITALLSGLFFSIFFVAATNTKGNGRIILIAVAFLFIPSLFCGSLSLMIPLDNFVVAPGLPWKVVVILVEVCAVVL